MSIAIPSAPGGTIAASDSDSISTELNANGLPVGTSVWNVDVGAFFKLTASTAALVPDSVLEVLNQVGTRWIIVDPNGGGITALTGEVTAIGPGLAATTVHALPLDATAIAAPATPAAGKGAVFVDSTSKNLCVKDDAGVVKHGVRTMSTASRVLSAIAEDGTVSALTAAELTAFVNPSTDLLQGAQSTNGRSLQLAFGTALTNADATLQPGSSKVSAYVMPAGVPQTAGHTITLGVTGASANDRMYIVWQDITDNHNWTVQDDAASPLVTINGATNGKQRKYWFFFTGGHWIYNSQEWVD